MDENKARAEAAAPLRRAVREARIEAAERSAVVVDLRDAEAARLEMLNEAIDPVFKEIPSEHLDLFDRGLTQGTVPRLWLDNVAHVAMGHDKRTYRLLVDTQYGRRVLAESGEITPIVQAVTRYVARRLVAREQGLASAPDQPVSRLYRGAIPAFVIGVFAGVALLFLIALLFAPR
jgi:hypothetical protein